MTRQRLNLQEAADVLGTTVDAVRMRVRRGSLDSEKGQDGRVYVWLDPDESSVKSERQVENAGELVDELRDRVRSLERMLEEERQARTEERRRHDTLMAQLVQRIPELEAPQERSPDAPRGAAGGASREEAPQAPQEGPPEAREYAVTSSAEPERGEPRPDQERAQEGAEPRSWWRRVFGE